MARGWFIGVIVALTGVATACGSSDSIDVADLVDRLPAIVAPDQPEAVTNVVCPDAIDRRPGAVDFCQARLSGDPITITVTQVDGDGAISVSIDAVPLVVESLSDDLAARLTEDLGRPVTVGCAGPRLIVPAAGDVVACELTDESGTQPVTVTLRDASGAYEVRLG